MFTKVLPCEQKQTGTPEIQVSTYKESGTLFSDYNKYFITLLDKEKKGWPSHLLQWTISSEDMTKFVKERGKGRSHESEGKRFRFEHCQFRDFEVPEI